MKLRKINFTLIEVLVAMGVFMVGVAPLLGVLASSTRIFHEQVNSALVSEVAMAQLSEIASSATVSDSSGSYGNNSVYFVQHVIDVAGEYDEVRLYVSGNNINSGMSDLDLISQSKCFTYLKLK